MFIVFASLLIAFLFLKLLIVLVRLFYNWLGEGRVISTLSPATLDKSKNLSRCRMILREYEHNHSEKERLKTSLYDEVEYLKGDTKSERDIPEKLTFKERIELYKLSNQLRDRYLDLVDLGWYQVVVIFLVGSFLGLCLEEVWMYLTAGLTQSRVGLVWGPFSPLYGFGSVFLTLMAWQMRKHKAPWWVVFLVSACIGGILEQATGWTMEHYLHAYSWSYLHLPDHITQWVAWRFLFFWGLLGLIWSRYIMPEVVYIIGFATTYRQVILVGIVALYLALDIFMTVACFYCKAQRDANIPPSNSFEVWVDKHYNNEFIEARFQNLVFGTASK